MPKILLVDDSEGSRDVLSRHLQRRGYDVVSAADGKQGVAMAHSELPDLILLDLNLPELDGWEAARLLKSASDTGSVPIIAMSAHAMPHDEERAVQAGCDAYHTKPAELPRLLSQIEELLNRAANS